MLIIGLLIAGLLLATAAAMHMSLLMGAFQGAFISAMTGALVTIATVTHTTAHSAGSAEARAVEGLYTAAQSAPPPFAQRLHGAAVCYARAVAGPEWAAMSKGDRSGVPGNWTGMHPGAIRPTLVRMTPAAAGYASVKRADATLDERRGERLARAEVTIPGRYYLGLALAYLFALSVAGYWYGRGRPDLVVSISALAHLGVGLVIVTFLLATANPFSGLLGIGPSAMEKTERRGTAEHMAAYGIAPPCDAQGAPAAYLLRLRSRA